MCFSSSEQQRAACQLLSRHKGRTLGAITVSALALEAQMATPVWSSACCCTSRLHARLRLQPYASRTACKHAVTLFLPIGQSRISLELIPHTNAPPPLYDWSLSPIRTAETPHCNGPLADSKMQISRQVDKKERRLNAPACPLQACVTPW